MPLQTGGSATAFPESRWYANGNQLLGYLEGRPGITRITTLEPWKMKEREPGARRPRLDADTRERIESLPMVQEAGDEDRAEMIASVIEAWREAEDGGALVEVEIEYESSVA